jgi:hypothetical protein
MVLDRVEYDHGLRNIFRKNPKRVAVISCSNELRDKRYKEIMGFFTELFNKSNRSKFQIEIIVKTNNTQRRKKGISL